MASYLFIVNPVAGAGKGPALKKRILSKASGLNHKIKIVITEFQGHAFKAAAEEGERYDYIIVCGGDGTINEVINGMRPFSDTKIGLLPIGSGNDLAKSLELSSNLNRNLDLIFNGHSFVHVNIGKAEIKESGMEEVTTRRFVNSVGIGFDAQVAKIKAGINFKTFSFLKYALAITKALFDYKPIDVNIQTDRFNINGKKLFVTIGNGKASGGGLYLTPNAILDDDLLDISVVEYVSRALLIRKFPLVPLKKTDKIKQVFSSKISGARIKLENPTYLHLDGELISEKIIETNITLSEYKISMITKTK